MKGLVGSPTNYGIKDLYRFVCLAEDGYVPLHFTRFWVFDDKLKFSMYCQLQAFQETFISFSTGATLH